MLFLLKAPETKEPNDKEKQKERPNRKTVCLLFASFSYLAENPLKRLVWEHRVINFPPIPFIYRDSINQA
jgi:hypothetical protein